MLSKTNQVAIVAVFLVLLYGSAAAGHTCDVHAVCETNDVGFNCTCDKGYEGNVSGCINIDECATIFPCLEIEECQDTDGSYNCLCNGTICHDNSVCRDNNGTLSCVCVTGYRSNKDGDVCVDINECSDPDVTDNCDKNAFCANTDGSFTCTCKVGYTGDGVVCTDVDECCLNAHNCTLPLTCSNTDGWYECVCGDDGICSSNAQCVTKNGTASCDCNTGYAGTGVSCSDVDECKVANDCHTQAMCMNNAGSYSCHCKHGFQGNGKDCSGASTVRISIGVLFLLLSTAFCSSL